MESSDYLIINDKFIFKPYFNTPIDTYFESISWCKRLIFSNHNMSFKFNDGHMKLYEESLYIGSKFNQYININLFYQLTHLIFGHEFNKSLILPQNLTHLTFGDDFNQPFILPQNLTHLTFGTSFNQHVILHENIIKLTIGKNFNQIINLPSSINHLILKCNNQSLIDNLPHGIINLELGIYFNSKMNDLPNSIKKIKFNCILYDEELNCLPKFLEYLELPKQYHKRIFNLPIRLKKIVCSQTCQNINNFNQSLLEISNHRI